MAHTPKVRAVEIVPISARAGILRRFAAKGKSMAASSDGRVDHWRRFRRLLAVAATVAAIAVAAALTGLAVQGIELRLPLVIAVTVGISGSIMLAATLMGLVFVSARSGHDDAVKALNEPRRSRWPWQ